MSEPPRPGLNFDVSELVPGSAGFRRIYRERRVSGSFDELADWVLMFGPQRSVWRVVTCSASRAEVGALVTMRPGFGPFRLHVPTVVTGVVSSPERVGFTYATLPGHPEAGTESFTVERRSAAGDRAVDEIWFVVDAVSRPASLLARASGPAGRIAQRAATRAYLWAAGRG